MERKGGGIRGKIVGFSAASARRMRTFLVKHQAPPGWITIGATFTIPGQPEPDFRDSCKLWRNFCRDFIHYRGWGMVWRVEKQTRGVLHWHALLIVPPHRFEDTGIEIAEEKNLALLRHEVSSGWLRFVDTIDHGKPVEGHLKNGAGDWVRVDRRSSWPGAVESACKLSGIDGKGGWMRYLQDDVTKHKSDQVPEYVGKHWGIIGRTNFVLSPCEHFDYDLKVERKQKRCLQRLATRTFPRRDGKGKPLCVFGRSLGFRPRRGDRGDSVWFHNRECDAESKRRLLDWARDLHEPRSSFVDWNRALPST